MTSASSPHEITTTAAGPFTVATPLGGASTAAVEGFGLADVTRVIKQRKLMIILVGIFVYALVVASYYATLIYFPGYTSEAFLELEPPAEGDAFLGQEGRFDPRNMESLLKTEAKKITQVPVMLKVVERPDFKQTEYYKWYKELATEAVFGLQEDLDTGPVTDTRLIRVALTTTNKLEAKNIVNWVVEVYTGQYTATAKDEMNLKVQQLTNTRSELLAKLAQMQDQLKRIRERADNPNFEAARIRSKDVVTKLREDLNALDARAAQLQAQIDSLSGIDPQQLPLTVEDQMIIESDPILRYWKQQVENMDIELKTLSLRLGESHRDVKTLRTRRQLLADNETAKREELITQVRMRRYENLRQELAQTKSVQARIQEQLQDAQTRDREQNQDMVDYETILDERKRLEGLIEEVERSRTQAEHASKDNTRISLRTVQPAQEAVEPTRPNKIAFLGGGAMLAIAVGLGLAFLRELTDNAIRTPLDVVRHGRLSVLGTVPQLDDEEADVEHIEHAVRLAPHSLVAEAFRRIRTNLQFSGPSESQRILLITSPGSGDGKTTVAINLAVTLAHGNQKVLLIDCNFRRPAIRREFANSRPEGLSNILIAQGQLADYVTKTDLPNLDVLSSGPMPPTPAELLGSPRMFELLSQALERYDRVILDGPPALLISDAEVLAAQVDGVVLVARAEDNTKGTLKRSREQLERINARVLGAVLNGVRARAGGYFREQYREFYDYTADEAPPELPQPKGGDDQA